MVVNDQYQFYSDNIPVKITIKQESEEFVLVYKVEISQISPNTELILDKIRGELIDKVNLGVADITNPKKIEYIKERFRDTIINLVRRYFKDLDDKVQEFFTTYLMHKSFGLGKIELLLDDVNLEEIVVNNAEEPVWVYHNKHGWLKTNIHLKNEEMIKNYAAIIGRKVGRSISSLTPLLDAQMETGDRANATLFPISLKGSTITLRKFASKPITVTDFLNKGVFSLSAASLIWLSVEFEMSMLVAGGTASGKTSFLNAICSFFPPNQRIISIEDTPEVRLAKYLHWIPMVTRLANVEGKGEVSMLDLIVNSLRMRPDRIVVGEIRRKQEAETLFEAMHTGHSVYATLHANNAEETINRLVNPPINVPATLLPAISGIVVMYRNRRTGIRRMFQFAEVTKDAKANVLMQMDLKSNKLLSANNSIKMMPDLEMQTGLTQQDISQILKEKSQILGWLAKKNINDVDGIGKVMATYYTNKDSLLKFIKKNV